MLKKNNKKEENEEKTSFIEIFKYLYNTYPGMKSLIILFLYGLLFTMLIAVVATNQSAYSNDDSVEEEETTTTVTSITYKEMLDNLVSLNSNIKYNIVIDEVTYYIDTIYEDNILTLCMNDETLNNELLANINKDYIIPSHLVSILESNKSIKTKEDNNMIYTYDIDNINYTVYTSDSEINKIEINYDNSTYIIEFE